MLFKHFLEDILTLKSANLISDYSEVDVDEIISCCGNVYFSSEADEETIRLLKEDIEKLQNDEEGNEKKIEELEEERDELEKKVGELTELLGEIKNDKEGSFKDLLERNESQEKQLTQYKQLLENWRKHTEKIEAENKKLRARKNKTVVEKDWTTGRFWVEWEGKKFELVEKQKIDGSK